jgi:hypothetical protein
LIVRLIGTPLATGAIVNVALATAEFVNPDAAAIALMVVVVATSSGSLKTLEDVVGVWPSSV